MNTEPTVYSLSPDAWDEFMRLLDEPVGSPPRALVALLSEPTVFDLIDSITPPACVWCDEPLTDNERDFEPGPGCGGYFSAHSRCSNPDPDGRFYVRVVQNAVSPARVREERYSTRRRARAIAKYTRLWNLREWACGEQLDIFVGVVPEEF